MSKFVGLGCVLVAVLAVLAPGSVPILDFGYTELDGDFTLDPGGSSGTLTADASAKALGGPYDSVGSVARKVPVEGVTDFDAGFVGLPDLSDFLMTLTVSGITPASGSGVGGVAITDVDGDTLNMAISGSFISLGGTVFFNGSIDSASFAGGDGLFEGSLAGVFPTSFYAPPPYGGSLTQLVFDVPWLGGSFADKSTLITGTLIPDPGTLALLGLGLGLLGWVKRRR